MIGESPAKEREKKQKWKREKRRQKTKQEKLRTELRNSTEGSPKGSKPVSLLHRRNGRMLSQSEAENIVEVDGIDSNEWCVCHGTYTNDVEHGNGSQWLRCQCGQWLHKDCVSDLVDLAVDD